MDSEDRPDDVRWIWARRYSVSYGPLKKIQVENQEKSLDAGT
ncbi:MAG: hypothetical protein ACLSG9_11960 [Eubacterium sp.]